MQPVVTDEVYQDLANGIVLRAVEDYRNALDGKSYSPYKSPGKVIKEIEKFFNSDWCKTLTKVSGEYIIEQIKKEHLERSNDESNTDTSNT